MKNFTLLICLFTLQISLFAQNASDALIFDAGDCGLKIIPVDSDLGQYNINLTGENNLTQQVIFVEDDCCNLTNPTTVDFFAGSADYDIQTQVSTDQIVQNTFVTAETTGAFPNRNVRISKRGIVEGAEIFGLEIVTGLDVFPLRTIATSDLGALTVAAELTPGDTLYRLRVYKLDAGGGLMWQTVVPLENVGHDDIFQGVGSTGVFIEQITPEPYVSLVEETPDGGFVIVNQHKKYFPPGASNQFANIIKLDANGNFLWNNDYLIPWREVEIGFLPSASLNIRGRVTSVEGTSNGDVYITFSSSTDINPNAQYRKFDNTGAEVESFSDSWQFLGNFSWFIKAIDDKVYWVKYGEIFTDSSPPDFNNDFAIFDITDGIDIIGANNDPVAVQPETPDGTFIPKDMIILPDGDFLVTGAYYDGVNFANDVSLQNDSSSGFVVRLENNEPTTDGGADLNLSVAADNPGTGIYQNVEITYTLTNEGDAAATGIVVDLQRNQTSVAVGSTPVAISQGDWNFGWLETSIWNVGTLAAGETATITLAYFTLSESVPLFGQVSATAENDSDSTPGNGTFGNATEDDEAFIEIGLQPFTISGRVFSDAMRQGGIFSDQTEAFLSGIELQLFIQGTDNLVATAVTDANGMYLFDDISAENNYSLRYAVQNDLVHFTYFVENNPYDLRSNFVYADDGFGARIGVLGNEGSSVVKNLALVDGTECTLESLNAELDCNAAGTSFTLNIQATGAGFGRYNISDNNGSLAAGNFGYAGQVVTVGPFAATVLPLTLTVTNQGTLPEIDCALSQFFAASECESDPNPECSTQISNGNVSACNDNGTATDPTDDTFTVQFTPQIINGGSTTNIAVPTVTNGTLTYENNVAPAGSPVSFTFNIQEMQSVFAGGQLIISVADANDATCTDDFSFTIPQSCSNGGGGNNGVDLELTVSSDVPTIYQSGAATFTLTNNGNVPATGVELEFAKNGTLNITGTPTASQGTPQLHWTDTPRWVVGSLAAGQSATITFNIFTLADEVNFYGEVTAQNETDADSAPGNGNGTTPQEDDEASYGGDGNGGGGGNPQECAASITNVNTSDCINNGTPADPADDVFTIQFAPQISNGGNIAQVTVPSVSNNSVVYTNFNVSSGTNLQYAYNIQQTQAVFTDGEIVFTVSDQSDPSCTSDFHFDIPQTCSDNGGGNDGVDLELTASTEVPGIYASGEATFTLTNNGNAPATGIELEFAKNATLNITDTPSTSQGIPQTHWTDTPRWVVGNLAAGQSATITFSIFTLSNNVNFYGQVTAQNEADSDSTPGNGNGIDPTEDDEASYGNGNNFGAEIPIFATNDTGANALSANIYPVPTDTELTVDIFNNKATEVLLRVVDLYGKALQTQNLTGVKGVQTVVLDVSRRAPGVYFVQLQSEAEMRAYRFVVR